MYVEKIKSLVSCMVIVQLIVTFVFAFHSVSSAVSRRAVVSYWQNDVNLILVNCCKQNMKQF